MAKKNERFPHTDFIMELYEEGFLPWQIALWCKFWTTRYVKKHIIHRRRKKDPRAKRINGRIGLTKEQFMSHQPRYFVGRGYICLRCKARCDIEPEFDGFACNADEKDYGQRGPKPKLSPEERYAKGLRIYARRSRLLPKKG